MERFRWTASEETGLSSTYRQEKGFQWLSVVYKSTTGEVMGRPRWVEWSQCLEMGGLGRAVEQLDRDLGRSSLEVG